MNTARLDQLLAFYEEDPEDAFTRFAIAQEYQKAGAPQQAISFYEQLIEDQPTYTGTYYHLGKLYEDAGHTEKAVIVYQQGIQASREQRNLKDLSELQDALLQAQGIGFDDEDE